MNRVLLTSSVYKPCVGGIENSLSHIGSALLEMGMRPTVVCSDLGPDPRQCLAPFEQIDGIEVYRYRRPNHRLGYLGLWPLLAVLPPLRFLRRLPREAAFDAVIARQPGPGLAAKLALPQVPLVYLVPSLAKELNRADLQPAFANPVKTVLSRLLNRLLLTPQHDWLQGVLVRRADAVVVFSENMRKQLEERFPAARGRVEVARAGVDAERFAPFADKLGLRRELDLPEDAVIAVAIGRFLPVKGFDLAIEAMSHLPEEARDLHLVLVGGGPSRDEAKQLAHKLGVADRVHFPGPTTCPERYYQASDLYVMPSRYESFGQTLLEAMSAGLPVLAFRPSKDVLTATKEIVTDGRDGLLVSFGGAPMAEGLARFCEMGREGRERLGDEGRRKVVGQYTWRELTERLLRAAQCSEGEPQSDPGGRGPT